MKKIIYSLALVSAALVSFSACKKVSATSSESLSEHPEPQKFLVCPLSNVYTASYYTLGTTLFGGNNGQGTSGPIDNKLNCSPSEGSLCNNVTSTDLTVTSLSADPSSGWNCLSDGVMTVTEQQTLITQVQNLVNSHKNSTYGTNYIVYNYDVWFMSTLCGGCPDGIMVMVKYKAGKICR